MKRINYNPPANLGEPGRSLWQSILSKHNLDDSGELARLEQICKAADRAEQCAEQIACDGVTVDTKYGPREHPLLKIELASRSFVARSLARLLRPSRPVGRPPSGGIGITWQQLQDWNEK